MNPSPWNERESSFDQERTFRRLCALHTLTDAWVKTLDPRSGSSYRLERITRVTLNPNLWLFEKTRLDRLPPELQDLVGAQDLESFLRELKETIWIIQGSTLENALNQGAPESELKSVLQQASWNHGKSYAEQIWGDRGDLGVKEAFQAFSLSHPYEPNGFVSERVAELEISFFWKQSPRQNPVLTLCPVLPLLSSLHSQWIVGFFFGLSRKTRVIEDSLALGAETHPRFTLLSTY